jgi:hypothetical protein
MGDIDQLDALLRRLRRRDDTLVRPKFRVSKGSNAGILAPVKGIPHLESSLSSALHLAEIAVSRLQRQESHLSTMHVKDLHLQHHTYLIRIVERILSGFQSFALSQSIC